MLLAARPGDSDDPGASAPLAAAGLYPTLAAGFDHGLVVLAMGRPYWLVPEDGSYRLLVEAPDLHAIGAELAAFVRESAHWPPPPPVRIRTPRRGALLLSLLWALAVIAVFGAECAWPGRWQAAGDLDARAVFERGQWWRLGTALFLHADAGHLISNLASGYFVVFAVLAVLGLVRGGLLLGAASVLGNFAVAAAYYPVPYESLGASTGIFAGLGLLTGRALRAARPVALRAILLPLGSGLTLLGLYGAGEAHTDVAAHAAGFLAGLLLGAAAGS